MNYNSTGFFPKFDPKIYWSFGVLLCLGIFLFIFQCSRHVDCEEANFYVFADNYAVKEVIEFGDKTKMPNRGNGILAMVLLPILDSVLFTLMKRLENMW